MAVVVVDGERPGLHHHERLAGVAVPAGRGVGAERVLPHDRVRARMDGEAHPRCRHRPCRRRSPRVMVPLDGLARAVARPIEIVSTAASCEGDRPPDSSSLLVHGPLLPDHYLGARSAGPPQRPRASAHSVRLGPTARPVGGGVRDGIPESLGRFKASARARSSIARPICGRCVRGSPRRCERLRRATPRPHGWCAHRRRAPRSGPLSG